jgi:hypothetical protein
LEHVTKAARHLEVADYEDEQRRASPAEEPAAGIKGPVEEMSVGALPKAVRQLLQLLAHNGVNEVATRPRDAERGDLQLDASLIENLPPRLFRLAKILAEETNSKDEFNGFSTYEGVAKRLTEHFGCYFSEHGVANLVCRLKQELWRKNVNPYYIESGQRGIRLRWRRPRSEAAA